MTEYQKSLQTWAANLSDEILTDYLNNLDRFSDEELDALFFEDMKRMS